MQKKYFSSGPRCARFSCRRSQIITNNLLRQAALLSLAGDGYIKGLEPSKKIFRYLCCLLLLLLLLLVFFF